MSAQRLRGCSRRAHQVHTKPLLYACEWRPSPGRRYRLPSRFQTRPTPSPRSSAAILSARIEIWPHLDPSSPGNATSKAHSFGLPTWRFVPTNATGINRWLPLIQFNLAQASHLQVPLQDARLQIVIPTKIAHPRSTGFVFDYEPNRLCYVLERGCAEAKPACGSLNFFPASPPP